VAFFPEMTYYVLYGTLNLYLPTHSLTTVFGHRQCLKWDGVLVAPLPWPLGRVDKIYDFLIKNQSIDFWLFRFFYLNQFCRNFVDFHFIFTPFGAICNNQCVTFIC